MKIILKFRFKDKTYCKEWKNCFQSPFHHRIDVGTPEGMKDFTLIPPYGYTFSVTCKLQPENIPPTDQKLISFKLKCTGGDISRNITIEAEVIEISGIPFNTDEDSQINWNEDLVMSKLVENHQLKLCE